MLIYFFLLIFPQQKNVYCFWIDLSNIDTKSKEFKQKVKALKEKQEKDFNKWKANMLTFMLYKKLNWE